MAVIENTCCVGCTGHKTGYVGLPSGWWVCAGCHKPTLMYLEKQLTKVATTLNYFRNGPHHNELWTNDQLLYRNDELPEASWITSYRWTDETITGSESGRIARVWVHIESSSKEA